MVWRDVEHRCNVRAAVDELELSVAHFQHGPGVRAQVRQIVEVEVVPGIDHEPQRGGAYRVRPTASLMRREISFNEVAHSAILSGLELPNG